MKSVSGKEFAKLLAAKGWQLQRVNGSHHIFTKIGQAVRISVPIHANRTLKTGLLRAMMKLADIADSEL